MALKFTVDSLDGIDESAQSFYKEAEGGKFILDVEGAVSADEWKAANQKAVDNATEAQRRRRTVERVTGLLGVESADEIDARIAELTKGPPPKDDGAQQAIIEQLKAESAERLAATEKKAQTVVRNGAKAELKAELLAAGFHPEIVDDIAVSAMNRVAVDESLEVRMMKADNSGPLAGSGPTGFATFADLAKELAAAKPSFLVDNGKGGGGKPQRHRAEALPRKHCLGLSLTHFRKLIARNSQLQAAKSCDRPAAKLGATRHGECFD